MSAEATVKEEDASKWMVKLKRQRKRTSKRRMVAAVSAEKTTSGTGVPVFNWAARWDP